MRHGMFLGTALAVSLAIWPICAHAAERKADALALQVALDRAGFSPGVIDGAMGQQTRKAIQGFQEANGLEVTGKLDAARVSASSLPVTSTPTRGRRSANRPRQPRRQW